MNLTTDVVDLYNYSDLIAMQRLDINHKLRQIILMSIPKV